MQGFPVATVRLSAAGARSPTSTEELVAEIHAAQAAIAQRWAGAHVVLMGYSMGASLAFLACAEMEAAGLVILDGGLPDARWVDQAEPLTAASSQNPWLHPRGLRSALNIDAASTDVVRQSHLRWRMTQSRHWPHGQANEIRQLRLPSGLDPVILLSRIECPVLCVAAGDRDPPEDHRSIRTARLTSARSIQIHRTPLDHEGVASGVGLAADNVTQQVLSFVRSIGKAMT